MAVSETVDAAIPDTVLTTCNIEDIQAGDLVLARDQHGLEIRLKPVKEVYKRTSFHLRHLTFESADGDQQTISTTDEHPFWSVTADEFLEAGSLPVGHQVTDPHSKTQTLVSSTREEFPNGIPVFNFQVEDFHTYYVAANAGDDVLLVHNADCNPYDLIPTHGINHRSRAFRNLKDDISKNGIHEAIEFVEHEGAKYIVNGHHRVRAAKELGFDLVPIKQVQLPHLGYKSIADLFN